VKFGYYKQEGISFEPGSKVIDAVHKIAQEVHFEDGTRMSASQLLNRFLFPPSTQFDYIEKLSGGEKRRLYLCTVLMQNPNFLILDEPTNDLDIITLNVLEEYLQSFGGCLVVISHDRFFMDKIVDHVFVFEGDGKITDFPGNYTQYRNYQEENELNEKSDSKISKQSPAPKSRKEESNKLTYKEKRELEQLESEIHSLEQQKKVLESLLNSGDLDHTALFEKSTEISGINALLEEKELRWLNLSDKDS